MQTIKQLSQILTSYNKKIKHYCASKYLYSYYDIIWCKLRYGFSPDEYFRWGIYSLSGLRRNEFVTSRREKALWKENSKEIELLFGDKAEFMKQYAQFTKRDFLKLTNESFEEFSDFVKSHRRVFIKYLWASGGLGAQTYEYTTDEDLHRYYQTILPEIKQYGMIAEELVIQHPKMYSVGEESINTIRVATYVWNDKVTVLACTLRMGGKECSDNWSAGGFCATVDIESGIVVSDCFHDDDHHCLKHPYTGTIVPGFQIPNWDKVIQICKEAALYKPGAVYIGWDVAVLDDDVLLIEANTNHGIFQIVDKVGKYERIKQARKTK